MLKSLFVSIYMMAAMVVIVFVVKSLLAGKEVVAQYRQLEALGARVAQTLGIANAYGVPMGMQVLGYDSETVLPTVIITEVGGRILWADETDNYRVRPEPELFLNVLREA